MVWESEWKLMIMWDSDVLPSVKISEARRENIDMSIPEAGQHKLPNILSSFIAKSYIIQKGSPLPPTKTTRARVSK